MVGSQHLVIHTRFIIKALDKALGDDLHQILIAGIIFRQQNHMIIAILAASRLPVKTRSGRHIDLPADDRLDAGVDRGAPHLIRAMHVAVVGDADGRHAQFLGALDQIRYFRCAVEQRIMRVIMQLHEICGSSHAFQFSWAS